MWTDAKEIQDLKTRIIDAIDLSCDIGDEEVKDAIRKHCSIYAK